MFVQVPVNFMDVSIDISVNFMDVSIDISVIPMTHKLNKRVFGLFTLYKSYKNNTITSFFYFFLICLF